MTKEQYQALVERYVGMSDDEFQRLLAHLNKTDEVNDEDEQTVVREAALIRSQRRSIN